METLKYLLTEALVSNEAEEITKAIFDKIKNKNLDELASSGYLKKIPFTNQMKKYEQENEKRRSIEYIYQREITGPFNDYIEEKFKEKGMTFTKGIRIFLNLYTNLPEIDKYGLVDSKKGLKNKVIIIKLFTTKDKIVSSYRKHLFHEIVHTLDFIRSGLKRVNPNKSIKKDGDKTYAYILDAMEKNAAINTLANFKKKYPKRWENIFTFSDLISKMGISIFPIYRIHRDKLLADPKFYKPMLKRLYREDLIPQKMSMALNSNLTLAQIDNFKSWDSLIKKAKDLKK